VSIDTDFKVSFYWAEPGAGYTWSGSGLMLQRLEIGQRLVSGFTTHFLTGL